ncbi:MAG: hemolysin [Flavobacteriales bacterium]|nr:hemolysin [Flavobacteriales bacterium]
MIKLILFFTLSIAFSFLCSVLEAVLLSVNPSYIRKQEKLRPVLFKDLNDFKQDIDRPLSAILTLNTIAHTIGAIGVGAQAAVIFGGTAIEIFGISFYLESVIAALMTLAILIFSEIIPKTIGANNWKKLAPFTVTTLKIMIKILGPLVWISQKITKGLKKQKDKSVLTRADLLAMTYAVSEDGSLHRSESEVIENVLNLPTYKIEDIMTPRKVMFSAKENETPNDLTNNERFSQFSRIPLFANDGEHIIGLVLKSSIFEAIVDGKGDEPLVNFKREVSFVGEDESLADFFKKTYRKREHMYIVRDKYQSVTGIVTLEDILETILGYEIVDETDQVEDLQKLSKDN